MTATPRALVVGDSAAARRRVATLLGLAGWAVFESAGTAPARRAAARLRPDLVVTDLRMRGGHGPALVQQLRRDGCDARFLVVTRRPDARVRAELAALGIDWLAKPVDPRALFAHLRTDVPEPREAPAATPMRIPPATRADAAAPDRNDDRYDADLPHQVQAVVDAMQEGDAQSVAAAALELAGAALAAGLPAVTYLCNSIAAEAYRGVFSHTKLMELLVVTSTAEREGAAIYATSR